MIAICTRQGAFVYDCSEAEADRRISNIEHSPACVKPEYVKDGLDYDGILNLSDSDARYYQVLNKE